jgi:hypothetical protein
LGAFGLKVLRTPVQALKANAYCERLMGTIRRECLDYGIPLSEKYLRTIMREWVVGGAKGSLANVFLPRAVIYLASHLLCYSSPSALNPE